MRWSNNHRKMPGDSRSGWLDMSYSSDERTTLIDGSVGNGDIYMLTLAAMPGKLEALAWRAFRTRIVADILNVVGMQRLRTGPVGITSWCSPRCIGDLIKWANGSKGIVSLPTSAKATDKLWAIKWLPWSISNLAYR